MTQHSPLIRQVSLVAAVLLLLVAGVWGWMKLFEPVPVPPVPPAKTRAFFDPKADIRQNPLFLTLISSFRGEIEPGPLGRVNPFAPIGSSVQAGGATPSGLGVVREVSLDGGLARVLARAKDGSMLALVEFLPTDDSQTSTFEIRRLVPDVATTAVARWTAPASGTPNAAPTLPVAMRQDAFGRTWLLSQGGYVGSIQSNGAPSWGTSPVFAPADSLAFLFGDIQLDGTGRFWVTDGVSVAMGDGSAFQSVDMVSQLADADRDSLGLSGITPEQTRALLRPWQLQAGPDGRMTAVSQLFAATFPLTLQGRPEILVASSTADGLRSAFVKMTPEGVFWSILFDASMNPIGMMRTDRTGVRELRDPAVLPKQALRNMLLFSAATQGLAALDYEPTATVLWRTAADGWIAQILLPSSAQPNDAVERIAVDGQGNAWAILRQKGLLLAQPPQSR